MTSHATTTFSLTFLSRNSVRITSPSLSTKWTLLVDSQRRTRTTSWPSSGAYVLSKPSQGALVFIAPINASFFSLTACLCQGLLLRCYPLCCRPPTRVRLLASSYSPLPCHLLIWPQTPFCSLFHQGLHRTRSQLLCHVCPSPCRPIPHYAAHHREPLFKLQSYFSLHGAIPPNGFHRDRSHAEVLSSYWQI